jgi:ABC-type sugar transport system permease subunit
MPTTYTSNMWAYNVSFQPGASNLAAAASMLMLLVSSVFAVIFVLRMIFVLRSGLYRLQDRD